MIDMRQPGKRAAALVVDRTLALLAPLLISRGPESLPDSPRVLVVRCDHIGDAVMSTGVLQPLRASLHPASLDVLAAPWAAPVFDGHPAVDRVISYATPWWLAARGASPAERWAAWRALPGMVSRLRRNRYDIAIDLRGDLRQIVCFLALAGAGERVSSDRTGGVRLLTRIWPYDARLHEVEKNAAVVAQLGVPVTPTLDVHTDRSLPPALEARLSAASGPAGFVVLTAGSREPSHSWSDEHAAAFVDLARKRLGLGTLVLGGPGDRARAAAIAARASAPVTSLAGETTLAQSIAIFARAAVALCVDSGPMHLAAASGAPVVALFGPTDPRLYRPWTDRAVVVDAGAPCGCVHPQCDRTGSIGACLRTLSPERIVDAVAALTARAVGA